MSNQLFQPHADNTVVGRLADRVVFPSEDTLNRKEMKMYKTVCCE